MYCTLNEGDVRICSNNPGFGAAIFTAARHIPEVTTTMLLLLVRAPLRGSRLGASACPPLHLLLHAELYLLFALPPRKLPKVVAVPRRY